MRQDATPSDNQTFDTAPPDCLDTEALRQRWRLKSTSSVRRLRMLNRGPRYFRTGDGLKSRCLYRLEDVEAFEAAHMAAGIADEIGRSARARTDAQAVAHAAKRSAEKRRQQPNAGR